MSDPYAARRTAEARIDVLNEALRIKPNDAYLAWRRQQAARMAMLAHAQIERQEHERT